MTSPQTITPAMLEQNPGLNQVLQFLQEKYGKVAFPDPKTLVNEAPIASQAVIATPQKTQP